METLGEGEADSKFWVLPVAGLLFDAGKIRGGASCIRNFRAPGDIFEIGLKPKIAAVASSPKIDLPVLSEIVEIWYYLLGRMR